ncbi:uncharacterized protein J3R85_005744 [Psidium guajava]|nr:uncharacterized protein J3R85_005744 [Psidium guajava]
MADSETVSPSPSRPDSNSGETPRIPTPENPGKDEQDDVRETKRRKNCPKALDKVPELARPDRHHQNHHSFTFDTKFNACSPENTPKFGSFNFCGQVQEERERTRVDEERGGGGGEEEEADKDPSNPPVINGVGKLLEGG